MKTLKSFFPIFALFACTLFFFSACDKKEKDEPVILLQGDFEGSFVLKGITFDFYFLEVKQSGENLSGSFEFSDGSGEGAFYPSSRIQGNNFEITSSYSVIEGTMKMEFEGTVNKARDQMTGTNLRLTATPWYGSPVIVNISTWSATKISKKSAEDASNEEFAGETMAERFVKLMQEQ